MAQRQKAKSDEWYTSENAVRVILPYIQKKSIIWCPFDLEDSNYVQVLRTAGHTVINTHIKNNEDFFSIEVPICDYIISNPPYSKKNDVLKRLLEIDKPFAMLMNVSGLYDSAERFKLLKDEPIQILHIYPRVKFSNDNKESGKSSPSYQSSYVCKDMLPQQLMAVRMDKS